MVFVLGLGNSYLKTYGLSDSVKPSPYNPKTIMNDATDRSLVLIIIYALHLMGLCLSSSSSTHLAKPFYSKSIRFFEVTLILWQQKGADHRGPAKETHHARFLPLEGNLIKTIIENESQG